MPIQTACPGCGGPIYVEDRAGMAVCQFCGTRFKVDLDGVAPKLEKDFRPPEPEIEVTPNLYDQFQPEQPEEHQPEPEPIQPPAYSSPSTFEPESSPTNPIRQMFGGRLWLVIALVVGALVIGSCLCMVLIAQGIGGLFK